MNWSWLGLLLSFVLPLCLFVAAYFVRIRGERPVPRALMALAAGCALLPALAAPIFAFYVSPQWREGARIVWRGVRADNAPLVVGGSGDETVVGWPRGEGGLGPTLAVRPGPGGATLSVSGGDGFIYDPESEEVLNGEPVGVGESKEFGGYVLRVNHLGWRWVRLFRPQIEVLNKSGQVLAKFDLRENRTRSMQYLLGPNVSPSLYEKANVVERERLEAWARGIWLLRTDGRHVYVLEKQGPEKSLPAGTSRSLVVRWPNLNLPFTLSAEGQGAALSFRSPWRFSAPLPPPQIDGCPAPADTQGGAVKLAFTSRPRPCEIAVSLPFGRKAGEVRQDIALDPRARVFTSGAIAQGPDEKCLPGMKCSGAAAGPAALSLRQGDYTFNLAISEDMPRLWPCVLLLACALGFFVWGLWLAHERMPLTNLWVVCGLALVVWNLLVFRLLLAFRYTLDPAALDALAVSGVTRAFFGLMVVPGLLLLLARLRSDYYEKPVDMKSASRAFRRAAGYLWALWLIGFFLSLFLTSRVVWEDLPATYHTLSFSLISLANAFVYGFIFWLLPLVLLTIYALHLYLPGRADQSIFLRPWRRWEAAREQDEEDAPDPEDEPFDDDDWDETQESEAAKPSPPPTAPRDGGWWGVLKGVGRVMRRTAEVALLLFSPWRWAEESYLSATKRPVFWAGVLRTWGGFWAYIGFFALRLGIFALVCWVPRFVLPGDKFIQEMAVPIFFYWVALDWIGLALALKTLNREERVKWEWLRLGLLAVFTISLPAVLLPLLMIDFGSLLPVFAILFPLAAVLLLAGSERLRFRGSRPREALASLGDRRAGFAAVFAILVLFGSGYFFYENLMGFTNVPVVRSQGRVFARLLNFKYGSGAQHWALVAHSFAGGEGVPYQELLNGNQHMWENKAIAHLGRWSGEGFGKAPTRLSQVRQDTLQYDSAFSFFVVSEYGFVGGAFLLLLYAVPLALVLIAGHEHFDAGYALTVIVASSFLIEALYHAGMNWGAFPLTGRNLPLLSVNSPSDLFRWTVLFGFAIQNIFWRYKGSGRLKEEAESLIPQEGGMTSTQGSVAEARVTGLRLVACGLVVLFFPLLTFATVLWSGLEVSRDTAGDLKVFSYTPLLSGVKSWLESGTIEYKEEAAGKGKQLVVHEERLDDPDAREFILQEVYRFNSRNLQSRIAKVEEDQEQIFRDHLLPAKNLQGYHQFLEKLRAAPSEKPRPGVFRLAGVRDEAGRVVDYVVETNDEFNVRFRFRHQDDSAMVPQVLYGDGLLIGPIWLNGHYASAASQGKSPLADLPWVAHLTRAMESEWQRLGGPAGAKQYGKLTLDPQLHEAAQTFAASKGVELHEKALARESGQVEAKLPPRVALAVINAADGRVHALGGWPSMTSTQSAWARVEVPTGNGVRMAVMPSAEWLEDQAPVELRRRYEGDRNFDRALLMGSTTKPLWASAVLKIHPRLNTLLRVQSGSGEENEAFGLAMSRPDNGWGLHTRSSQWLTFEQFLSYSDNRYQVRVGMLGLAAKDGDRIKLNHYKGSPVESLSGQPKAEGREPEFTPAVHIARRGERGTVTKLDLADSELGRHLHDMYSVGIRSVSGPDQKPTREFLYRRSFWTLNEQDDSARVYSAASELLDIISPQAPDFYFDKLTDPRYFVNMLLGGQDNRWANVDFAAAFGSCLTGRPVLAHIVEGGGTVQPLPGRKALDPSAAAPVRRGLNAAVEQAGGTAHKLAPAGELAFLKQKVKLYAKTGTLAPGGNINETSRIVFAAIKWKDESKGEVESGLIFSVAAENAQQGLATEWLRAFIIENKGAIARLMGI